MLLEYKGIKINYSDKGKGTAVILLHGFLENSSMWDTLTPLIIRNNRAITIDLLGHGLTPCIGYIHTMEDMAEAVNAVISSLKLKRVILIGHSMGGYVALAYSKKYAKKVKGLCLINSTYEEDSKERKRLRARANNMVKTNFKNTVRLSIYNLFNESSKITYKREIKKALDIALETSLQGYIACNKGMIIRKNEKKHFINAPYKKLVLLGKEDAIINSQKLKNELDNNNIRVIEFPGGHMSYIENESLFLQSIMYFIENI